MNGSNTFAKWKKGRGVVLGLLMALMGVIVLWVTERSAAAPAGDDRLRNAVEIQASDIAHPVNAVVLVHGTLEGTEIFEDEFLKPSPWIYLERRAEMFQWIETFDQDGKPKYDLGWFAGEKDFFSFQKPTGHENPLLPVKGTKIASKKVRLGNWEVAKVDFTELETRVKLTADGVKDEAVGLVEGDRINVRRDGRTEGVALGDTRVTYSGVRSHEVTALCRVFMPGKLHCTERVGTGSPIHYGNRSLDQLREAFDGERQSAGWRIRLLGMALFGFGLFSVLQPFSATFAIGELRGVRAVLAVSFGSALLLWIVLWITAFFSGD